MPDQHVPAEHPFPDREAVRAARAQRKAQRREAREAALGEVVDAVLSGLGAGIPVDRPVLAARLDEYFRRTALTSPEGIRSFRHAGLVDSIREDPSLLASGVSIAAMLRAHAQRNSQAAARLRKTLAPDIPPRSVLWREGAYALEEATDPRHLQQDTATLGHCVGATPDEDAMAADNVPPGDPREVLYLPYWRKICRKESRILTLTRDGEPLVTIEYETKSRAITQIEGRKYVVTGREKFFPALCGSLHSIRDTFELKNIAGLPHVPDGHVLTRDGKTVVTTAASLPDALTGTIVLTDLSANLLPVASRTRLITVDVTALSGTYLTGLETVAGTLRTTSEAPLVLPALRSGNVEAMVATAVNLPLHASGDVYAHKARTVRLPQHRTGDVNVGSARSVRLPMHESGYVIASSARSVSLPRHRTGNVDAIFAFKVNLPLHESGDVDARAARKVILTQHRSGNVMAGSALSVSMPQHRSGDVDGMFATTVNLPRYRVGDVGARFARSVILPQHQAGDVNANYARTISLPMHESGNVIANYAGTVSLPQHRSGIVRVYNARSLSLPRHEDGDVDASSALSIVIPAESAKHVRAPPGAVFRSPNLSPESLAPMKCPDPGDDRHME